MSKKQIQSLLKLNIPIVVVNIILFSKGLVGLNIFSENFFIAGISISVIAVSIFLVIYGNYKILFKKLNTIDSSKLKTPKDWIDYFEDYTDKHLTSKYTNDCIEQIKMFEIRYDHLYCTLKMYFSPGDLTFSEFSSVIEEAKKIFFNNYEIISIQVNLVNTQFYPRHKDDEKLQENFEHIKDLIAQNDEILSNLYDLNFELGRISINDTESKEVLENLNKLISNTKLYK